MRRIRKSDSAVGRRASGRLAACAIATALAVAAAGGVSTGALGADGGRKACREAEQTRHHTAQKTLEGAQKTAHDAFAQCRKAEAQRHHAAVQAERARHEAAKTACNANETCRRTEDELHRQHVKAEAQTHRLNGRQCVASFRAAMQELHAQRAAEKEQHRQAAETCKSVPK